MMHGHMNVKLRCTVRSAFMHGFR